MKTSRPAAADPDDDTVSLSRAEYEELLADAASWQASEAVANAEAELMEEIYGPPPADTYGLAVNRGAAKLPLLRGCQPDPYRIEEGLKKIGRSLGDRQFPVPRRPAGKSTPPHACAYGLDRKAVA